MTTIQTDYREPIRLLKATPHKDLKAMAAHTGLGLQTLRAMKYGVHANPRVQTLEAMARYFASVQGAAGGVADA